MMFHSQKFFLVSKFSGLFTVLFLEFVILLVEVKGELHIKLGLFLYDFALEQIEQTHEMEIKTHCVQWCISQLYLSMFSCRLYGYVVTMGLTQRRMQEVDHIVHLFSRIEFLLVRPIGQTNDAPLYLILEEKSSI